jgi:hypothetical protein
LKTPAELAEWLNVKPSWVYEHAEELGVLRLGTGPRARLRFDVDGVRKAISCSACSESDAPDPAPAREKRQRRRAGKGTSVPLLPIRCRS